MVGMMTREAPLPSATLQFTLSRPVTANSQLWSCVSTVNRIVRRLKKNTEKYAAEESERIQEMWRGLMHGNYFHSFVTAENRVKWWLL
jgi:hypothetical protein